MSVLMDTLSSVPWGPLSTGLFLLIKTAYTYHAFPGSLPPSSVYAVMTVDTLWALWAAQARLHMLQGFVQLKVAMNSPNMKL